MNKIFIFALFATLFVTGLTSCSKDDDSENIEYKALFRTTDKFVEKLGSSGSSVDSEETSDGNYIVSVLGRLIVVKKKHISGPSYSEVRDALDKHYKSNSRVKEVFKNQSGTITIDCRK